MSKIPRSPPGGRRLLLGPLICGFAVCNFVIPPIVEAIATASIGPSLAFLALIGILYGWLAGQCGLLAIWGVFGPLRAPVRLIATLAVFVFLFASFAAGFWAIGGSPAPDDLASICWFLPMFFLAIQAPLWGVKLVTGGRITCRGPRPGQSETPRRQFGLRDVMVATVVIAVALSLASSGIQVSESWGTENWIPLSIFCLSATLVSTFATLPCLWAGMIARNKPLAAAIVAIYTLLLSLLCLVVIVRLNPGTPMQGEAAWVLFAFSSTLMAVILATLHVARLCGYTYIGQHRPQPALPTECPFAVGGNSCGDAPAGETGAFGCDDGGGPFA